MPTRTQWDEGDLVDRLAYATAMLLSEYIPCLREQDHVPARYDPPGLGMEALADYTGMSFEDMTRAVGWVSE